MSFFKGNLSKKSIEKDASRLRVLLGSVLLPPTAYDTGCVVETCDDNGFDLTAGAVVPHTLTAKSALYYESSAQTAGLARGVNSVDLQIVRSINSKVATGSGSALVGGSDNRVTGQFAGVFCGASNTALTEKSAVVGGETNTINANCGHSGIFAGRDNQILTNSPNSVILGGGNNIAGHDFVTVIGQGAETNNDGQFAHGVTANGLSSAVAIQAGQHVLGLRQDMVTATWYSLQTLNFSNGLSIPTDSVWTFRILLTGATAGMGNVSSYEIVGAIENDAGTVTLLASTVTTIYEDTAGHNAQVIADDTNNKIQVQVQQNTGVNQVNVYHATVITSEINTFS